MPADKPAATGSECPKCGGKKNNRCFLWTQTTGWGDVECGPECDHSFHAKDIPISPAILARRERALFRANSRPTTPASQPTVTLDRETWDNICISAERDVPPMYAGRLLALLRAAEQK